MSEPQPYLQAPVPDHIGLEIWEDIRYVALFFECEAAPEHIVEVKVYRLFAVETYPAAGQVLFEKADAVGGHPTEKIDEAQVYLSGHVKWDGCSNWHFDEQDECNLHFCGVEDAANIGTLFRRLYEKAETLMPWTEF